MLSALGSPHTHTPWPVLGSPWCVVCSAQLDWFLHFLDHLSEKE